VLDFGLHLVTSVGCKSDTADPDLDDLTAPLATDW